MSLKKDVLSNKCHALNNPTHLPKREDTAHFWGLFSGSDSGELRAGSRSARCPAAKTSSGTVPAVLVALNMPDLRSGTTTSFQIRPEDPCLLKETEDLCRVVIDKSAFAWNRNRIDFSCQSLLFLPFLVFCMVV